MNRNIVDLTKLLLFEDDDEEEQILGMLFLLPHKRKNTREMISNRNKEGVYNLLIKKYLFTEEDQFVKYFRVSTTLFYSILNQISPDITSPPCNRTPHPISAEQKLCISLRYFFSSNVQSSSL